MDGSFVEFIHLKDKPSDFIDETKVTANETQFKILVRVFRLTTNVCTQKKVFELTKTPKHLKELDVSASLSHHVVTSTYWLITGR